MSFSDFTTETVTIKCNKTRLHNNNKCNEHKGISVQIKKDSNHQQSQTTFDCDNSTQTNYVVDSIDVNSLSSSDLASLKIFLTKIEPIINKEFEENISTKKLFNNYTVQWDDAPNSIYLKNRKYFKSTSSHLTQNNSLNLFKNEEKSNNINNDKSDDILFGILCMDINCTNSRIGIGYGLNKHISWCLHSTHVVIWNMNNNNNNKYNKPEHSIEISSCCTSIKYHPKYDNILCFGLFNGLISIWDFNNDGNSLLNKEICVSSTNDYCHREVITDLYWIKNINSDNNNLYNLISTSIDGKLLIWNFVYNNLLNPIGGYKLIPTKIYNGGNNLYINNNINFNMISITNISFPTNDEYNTFIIGTAGGAVLNGIIYEENNLNLNCKKIYNEDNIKFDYLSYRFYKNISNKSHQIQIQRNIQKYLKLNKNIKIIKLKHIFTANIHNLNQNYYPQISIKLSYKKHIGLISCIQFSPFNRNIFLTCSNNGYLRIFSIFSSAPIIELKSNKNTLLFDCKWSPIRQCVIAAINNENELLIYDLWNNNNMYDPTNTIKIPTKTNKNIKLTKLCFNNSGDMIFISDNIGTVYSYKLSNILIQHQPKEMMHLKKWTNIA